MNNFNHNLIANWLYLKVITIKIYTSDLQTDNKIKIDNKLLLQQQLFAHCPLSIGKRFPESVHVYF